MEWHMIGGGRNPTDRALDAVAEAVIKRAETARTTEEILDLAEAAAYVAEARSLTRAGGTIEIEPGTEL